MKRHTTTEQLPRCGGSYESAEQKRRVQSVLALQGKTETRWLQGQARELLARAELAAVAASTVAPGRGKGTPRGV